MMVKSIKQRSKKLEAILWSVALPGFGQLLNRKYIKGFLLVGLEFAVNVFGNLNKAIVLSSQGHIQEAIEETNYLWLMFYPCLYFFAIWDAYKDASGGEKPFAFLPCVSSAYLVTISVAVSPKLKIFGYLVGPIWLPILTMPIGLMVGMLIRFILVRAYKDENPGRV